MLAISYCVVVSGVFLAFGLQCELSRCKGEVGN
jgi:hypothetical protein